jgi:hypothetical protein
MKLNELNILLEFGDAIYDWKWQGGEEPTLGGPPETQFYRGEFITDEDVQVEVEIDWTEEENHMGIEWDYGGYAHRRGDDIKSGKISATKIMSTIMDIVREAVHLLEPGDIDFATSKKMGSGSDSRAKLYKRLIDRFAQRGGYNISKINAAPSGTYFTLTRI